jgi:hypothetical protein
MSGFFTSLFGGGRRNVRARTPSPVILGPTGQPLRTDNRKRTPNAEETGRKAIPRPAADTVGTTPGVTPPVLVPDPITAAHMAAFRQRKKGRTQRASALLGTPRQSVGASLRPRTLLGS